MKTWGEMTDEEQGALLLARHRGEVIELWDKYNEEWLTCELPCWVHAGAYRVKKEPVVEVHKEPTYVMGPLGDLHVLATTTYTDGKLTKIHWEADQ